ncbi:MAG: alpha/beta hydrolase [Asticcacaulis sp.]|nr:alpha/beta hydrolase [Asticcacaulis sp.]
MLRILALSVALTALPAATDAAPWQPPAGYREMALWPATMTIARPDVTGPERTETGPKLLAGKTVTAVKDVTRPTMAIYPAKGKNTGAAVVVFPGGGYTILAIDLEGTEVCDWLVARGITCVVLKYRVPGSGPQWRADCKCHKTPAVPMALQDSQRAIALLRGHAAEYGIDPKKVGVLGFSAGGHMVASVSTHDRTYKPVDAADKGDPRPNFAVALYPGHLWAEPVFALAKDIRPDAKTPPTMIIQAEDDPVDDVRNSLVYFVALKQAKVPTEMHIYATGGHAFGLRPTDRPITRWPDLVDKWLVDIGIVR